MDTHVAPTMLPEPTVTLDEIKAILDKVPANRLHEVYALVVNLQKDAAEHDAADKTLASKSSNCHGLPLEEFLRESVLLGETDETDLTENAAQ